MATPTAPHSRASRKDQRPAIVSLMVVGTWVEAAKSARASKLSALIGSSNQKGSNSSRAWAIRLAVGRFQSEWNSTMMSICMPTAWRILRKGSRAVSRSALEM